MLKIGKHTIICEFTFNEFKGKLENYISKTFGYFNFKDFGIEEPRFKVQQQPLEAYSLCIVSDYILINCRNIKNSYTTAIKISNLGSLYKILGSADKIIGEEIAQKIYNILDTI